MKEKTKINKADLLAAFLKKARDIHGNTYDYSNTQYVNARTKVKINCKVHGEFTQTPDSHVNKKSGCIKCGHKKVSEYQKANRKRVTVDDFISRSKVIHGCDYSYADIVAINKINDKLPIKCGVHGTFWQSGTKHLLGSKCPTCMKKKVKNGWTSEEWRQQAEKSSNFDSYKVYLIECTGNGEKFYKIGKTFKTIDKRFRSVSMPYTYKVVSVIKGPYDFISKLEHLFHSQNKKNSYTPQLRFDGCNECYTTIKGYNE